MAYPVRLKSIQSIVARHSSKMPYLLLLLWQGILLIASNVQTSLMAHDEGWYATLALSLLRSQAWLTPKWWGQLIYDKTSGVHWMIATAYSFFGVSETSARLPAGIACLISIVLIYAIGSTLLNRRSAFLGALCLSTIIMWTQYGQLATQDMPLVAIELTVIWALLQLERYPQQRLGWGVVAGLGFGLGFFVKGFMVVLPMIALLPYLLLNHKRHKHLFNPGLYLGFLLGLGSIAFWFLALWQTHGQEPFIQLFGILALAASADYHNVGPWYYLWNIPANFLPWTPLVLLGLINLFKSPPKNHLLLTCGYPAVLMLQLQIFSTKTIYYPLQIYPFLGLYSGYALDRLLTAWQSSDREPKMVRALSYFYGTIALLALIFGLGLPSSIWLSLGILESDLQQELLVYTVPILVVCGFWLVHGASGLGMFERRSRPEVWLSSLLIGPWLAIGLAGTIGLSGNYSADVKSFCLQPVIRSVLNQHTVDLVMPEQPDHGDHQTWILTSFCSSQWGQRVNSLQELTPGTYAWVSSPTSAELDAASDGYTRFGEIRGWTLIQKSLAPVDLK